MPHIQIKGRLVQKLLTRHTQTHTQLIALPGPLEWSVNIPHHYATLLCTQKHILAKSCFEQQKQTNVRKI